MPVALIFFLLFIIITAEHTSSVKDGSIFNNEQS